MIHTLDDTDRQLLSLLQANARESTATLARRLGLARTTVVSRIARLEREGVVAGYGVRLAIEGRFAVLNALPFHCAVGVATLCARAGVHYFDLTEDGMRPANPS